ncbi:MAG: Nucleoside 2-deoxyribosyltransferase [Smithella sp. PtaU1.Bin162]|nr:MAG: Nucleoside 2-deoxyribosyltransferase [Smithella sp. PtaU1.Bin162]
MTILTLEEILDKININPETFLDYGKDWGDITINKKTKMKNIDTVLSAISKYDTGGSCCGFAFKSMKIAIDTGLKNNTVNGILMNLVAKGLLEKIKDESGTLYFQFKLKENDRYMKEQRKLSNIMVFGTDNKKRKEINKMKRIKVYMAGKIAPNDWRYDIFKNLYDHNCNKLELNEQLLLGNFEYFGPFFIDCSHMGCCFGDNSHGRGLGLNHYHPHITLCDGETIPEKRETVVEKCLSWLNSSDIVFCWLNKNNAYGTLVEIGYAHSKNKPIFIAMPIGFNVYQDMWFALTLADMTIMARNHLQAWTIFQSVADRLLERNPKTLTKWDFLETNNNISYEVQKHGNVENIKVK